MVASFSFPAMFHLFFVRTPGGRAGRLGLPIALLCYGFRGNFARIITFNRAFIPGFLLAALLRFFRLSAFVIGADNEGSRLQILLQQIGAAALGTGLRDRFVGRGEPALGIVRTAIENVAAAGLLLGQVPGLAFRTLHADVVLLDPLAFRISAAGDELAVPAVPQQQIAPALRTLLVERNVRDLLTLVEPASGLAVGVSRARHELPEAPTLQHHRTAAVLAVLFLGRLLHVGRIEIGQVDRILFGKCATVGIGLVVCAAGVERAVLAPLDDQRRATALALLVRGLFHALDILHMLLGIVELALELLVEVGQRVRPALLTLFDLVQLLFQPGRIQRIKDVLEIGDEQVRDHEADFGRYELATDLLHVLPLLYRADDRGVGGRPANTLFFEFLHQ